MIEQVILESDISSKTAKEGDIVWGTLDDDLRWGSKIVAAKDSIIRGHVVAIEQPRTFLKSSFSSRRRCQSSAAVSIQFDELIDQDSRSWPIEGKLCRWSEIVESNAGASPRIMQVDDSGRSVRAGASLTEKEKNVFLAARVASYVPIPAAMVIGLAAKPVVMGVAGAANPKFAFNRAVDTKERGIRKKAFAYGFVTGLPGALLVTSCVRKGEHIEIRAGDRVAVEMTFKNKEYLSRSLPLHGPR